VDLTTPFKAEVFRPIAGLLIPGVIAGLPYALVIAHYFPGIAAYRDEHELVYYAIAALLVVGIGFVLEDIGTGLELQIDKYLIKHKHPDLYDVWHEYLAQKFDTEPVGQRYLRTVLLRFKFELSTAVSLITSYVGLVWLSLIEDIFTPYAVVLLGLFFLTLAVYLVYQAYLGAAVLADVRRILVGKAPIS
jgi:hypothetical protein